MKKISDIPELDRPREKLLRKGAKALSDLELIAVLLGKGTEKHDVMHMANHVLKTMDASSSKPDLKELQLIEGMGPAGPARTPGPPSLPAYPGFPDHAARLSIKASTFFHDPSGSNTRAPHEKNNRLFPFGC